MNDGTALASGTGTCNEVKNSINHIIHHHSNGCCRHITAAAARCNSFHFTNNGLQLSSKPGAAVVCVGGILLKNTFTIPGKGHAVCFAAVGLKGSAVDKRQGREAVLDGWKLSLVHHRIP